MCKKMLDFGGLLLAVLGFLQWNLYKDAEFAFI